MIQITTKTIKDLKPCSYRYANFILHYKGFKGSIIEFLRLSKISYEDKIWVSKRLLTRNQLQDWAILCAESVLCYYEKKTNDLTIREQLTLLKNYRNLATVNKKSIRDMLREKRDAAVYDAYAAAAAVADAAAAAAAAVADAAAAAAAAADYTAADYTAYAAAYAAYAADYTAASAARQKQQQINLDFLKEVLESNND